MVCPRRDYYQNPSSFSILKNSSSLKGAKILNTHCTLLFITGISNALATAASIFYFFLRYILEPLLIYQFQNTRYFCYPQGFLPNYQDNTAPHHTNQIYLFSAPHLHIFSQFHLLLLKVFYNIPSSKLFLETIISFESPGFLLFFI